MKRGNDIGKTRSWIILVSNHNRGWLLRRNPLPNFWMDSEVKWSSQTRKFFGSNSKQFSSNPTNKMLRSRWFKVNKLLPWFWSLSLRLLQPFTPHCLTILNSFHDQQWSHQILVGSSSAVKNQTRDATRFEYWFRRWKISVEHLKLPKIDLKTSWECLSFKTKSNFSKFKRDINCARKRWKIFFRALKSSKLHFLVDV